MHVAKSNTHLINNQHITNVLYELCFTKFRWIVKIEHLYLFTHYPTTNS